MREPLLIAYALIAVGLLLLVAELDLIDHVERVAALRSDLIDHVERVAALRRRLPVDTVVDD